MRFIRAETLTGLRKVNYTLVALLGLVVLVSWHTDWPYLRSVYDEWVTMKPTVCVCFVLSAGIMAMKGWRFVGWRYTVQLTCVLGVGYTMGILLIASSVQIYSGVEYLFADPTRDSMVQTRMLGLPSVGGMVSFLLIALYGWLNLTGKQREFPRYIVFAIGIFALIGYALGIDWMHYWIPGISSSMAFHTSLALILLVL